MDCQKQFIEIAPVILAKSASHDLGVNALSTYAAAFANVGLLSTSKQLVQRIKSLDGISNQSLAQILRISSEFPSELSTLSAQAVQAVNHALSTFNAAELIDVTYYLIALDSLSEPITQRLQ